MPKAKAFTVLNIVCVIIFPIVIQSQTLAVEENNAQGTQHIKTLVLVGDSTMCEYVRNLPDWGWGMFIEEVFQPGSVEVHNLAGKGRSTKTFIKEKFWDKALALEPDYVFIQFGHNDSHDPQYPEATDAKTDYRDYLRRYIDDARAIGATPILITPMVRRTFHDDGTLDDNLEPYADAMKAVAREKKVALIDLHSSSWKFFEPLGPDVAQQYACNQEDRTHFNEKGARTIAELVLRDLPEAVPQLAKLLADARQDLPSSSESIRHEEILVKAPFEMPSITIPDFSRCPKFSIKDFGAKQGDKESTTRAIAKAITKANEAGGGRVVVPEGKWSTGAVHLKSNVNLHVEKGAILEFSEDPQDYLPAVQTTWEGMECFNYSPLIYAFDCKNVAITGEGTLDAKMDVWKTWFSRPPAHMEALKNLYTMASTDVPVQQRQMAEGENHLRPQFIQFNRCKNVLLEGVSIVDSPFWVIHPFLCRDVVIRGVNVKALGHNNDGVDPEMSQNMLIEDCVFDQGDDAIAIKAGRNQDAWRLNTPTENVVMRNCLIKAGHQLVAIGSEMSGGVRNVYVHDCRFENPDYRLQNVVFLKTNERRGGFMENIYVDNIEAGEVRYSVFGVETDVLYQWRDIVPTYETRISRISDIHLRNIKVRQTGAEPFRILGDKRLPVTDVTLDNITIDTARIARNRYENTENVQETDIMIGEILPKDKEAQQKK